MKGRIKRDDLDHLLRLIQSGRADGIGWQHDRHVREDGADDGLFGHHGPIAPDQALWDANHTFWTEKLKHDTDGAWSDAQCTAGAAIINTAEYQHVVFGDIANALSRGLSRGRHHRAFDDDDAFGRFSFRADHIAPSVFDETVDLLDGSTGQVHQVKLATVLATVHEPDLPDEHPDDYDEAEENPAEEAAPAAPDHLLSPKHVDLGELTGSRTREAGHVSFNQARGDLFAQCGLSTLLPYTGWSDFQERNHLSDDLIADLKAAYPDGFAALDLWVGGLAETPAVGDLGPTIAAAVSAEISHLRNGTTPSALDLLAGTHILSEISDQSWSDIVARNAHAAHLADYMLGHPEPAIENSFQNIIAGTDGDDVLIGTDASDLILGGPGDDFLDGRGGPDVLIGGSGNDTYVVNDIKDRVIESPDGGAEDTILTNLDSFILDDAAPGADADDSGESLQPLVPDTAAIPEAALAAEASGEDTSQDISQAIDDPADDIASAANVENLTYTGDASFFGRGNSSNNVISGRGGDDVLWGRGGDDVLHGGGGDDALYGGSDDDVLFGGHGDDRLDGGSGDDVLYVAGRATPDNQDPDDAQAYGHDTIVLRPGFGNDVVIGFDARDCSAGHDRLDVSAYTSLTADSIGTEIQITACGPHTIITINGDAITLLDVNANTIGKDDFIFS